MINIRCLKAIARIEDFVDQQLDIFLEKTFTRPQIKELAETQRKQIKATRKFQSTWMIAEQDAKTMWAQSIGQARFFFVEIFFF